MAYARQTEMERQGCQEALGKTLYLFKCTTPTNRALISAHGGFWKGTTQFTVPAGVTLHFYAPHGDVLGDPGIAFLAEAGSSRSPDETIGAGGRCWNYRLSKYQGSHGGQAHETYQKVGSEIGKIDTYIGNFNSMAQKKAMGGDLVTMNKLLDARDKRRAAWVITIRNRNVFLMGALKDVKLKDVITTVRAKYPQITEFHCSHCRSNML